MSAPASAPRPFNPPGLSAIRYRIGAFTSFRRAMLDRLAQPDLLTGVPNPFAAWREGSDGDYQTAFIELWAYLADILTFYQERIANEAYLPSSAQIDSMARLAALIGYRPSPGSGAGGVVAFTVAKGKSVALPAGFRVGSKAKPPAAAAVFETISATAAIDEHNAIPLSPVAPTNQFAKLASFGTFFGPKPADPSTVATIANDLYGDAAPIYVSTFPAFQRSLPASLLAQFSTNPAAAPTVAKSSILAKASRLAKAPTLAESASLAAAPTFGSSKPPIRIGLGIFGDLRFPGLDLGFAINQPPIQPGFSYRPFTNDTTRTVVFRGLNLGVKAGDHLLAVENEGGTDPDHRENATLHQVTGVSTDKDSNTTTIQWVETPNQEYDVSQSEVAVYAFRVTAGVFGNAAPAFDTLPSDLTKAGAPFANKRWDDTGSEWHRLPKPEEASQSQVLLDGVFDNVKATPQKPGWAVLLTDSPPDPFIAHVLDARPVSRSAYAITSKVTRLTFSQSETIPSGPPGFPVRTTVVLCGTERLPLQDNLPLPERVSGDTLILKGIHRQLQAGQQVILTGPLVSGTAAAPVTNAELRAIKSPPNANDKFDITSVTLDRPLDETYTRAGASLLANVTGITQGETVKDETLGSGNGRELQSFPLKKSPLTYLPSTDPKSFAAVESTLVVTVNGVRWREEPTLLESPPDDQAFTTTSDPQGNTTVVFGDGFHGARPPSGVGNIHARYRKGIGASGNVDPGGVQQLLDSAAGLQKAANPLPTSGGADPENVTGIRRNAPASVRAFGRAVSAGDYASLALTFPGVGKASSVWITRDESLQPVVHPYVQLTVAAANQLPLAQQPTLASKLRRFLDQRRDPNVRLRIVDFTPVFLEVAVTVDIDDRFPRQATLAGAQAAAAGYFAFEHLDFGESIHLSSLYAALLAVRGVLDANVTTLRLAGSASAGVADTIFIGPTQIASIGGPGTLAVNPGQGGFADQ